jgi:serine/threonine protein kinase
MADNSTSQLGNYELKRAIGQGGGAVVYLAEDRTTHQSVAVKLLPMVATLNSEYTRRFFNEARLATQLDHPHIVHVYDYGRDNGHFYLVMQYVDGPTVKARIVREGRLRWRDAVQIAIQVAEGLAAGAREGIIHRDVKPENILLDSSGAAYIADLGLAKEEGANEPLPSDTSLGTPDYMSPEQVNNSETVDFRTDIYALGASLFHMVCGKAPYTGRSAYEVMVKHISAELPSPKKYAPDLPHEVADVMRKMMARDPEDRYQSYAELIADLKALLEGGEVKADAFDEVSMLAANGNGHGGAGQAAGPGLLARVRRLFRHAAHVF